MIVQLEDNKKWIRSRNVFRYFIDDKHQWLANPELRSRIMFEMAYSLVSRLFGNIRSYLVFLFRDVDI
jgi:hypothetical protein